MSVISSLSALLGGALIGVSASLLLLVEGRVAGVSGILAESLVDPWRNLRWRVPFLAGLVAAGAALHLALPGAFVAPRGAPLGIVAAGLLVGFGTRLANGCTSGHGVSGLSRFSARSLVATLTFIAFGALATYASRGPGGAS